MTARAEGVRWRRFALGCAEGFAHLFLPPAEPCFHGAGRAGGRRSTHLPWPRPHWSWGRGVLHAPAAPDVRGKFRRGVKARRRAAGSGQRRGPAGRVPGARRATPSSLPARPPAFAAPARLPAGPRALTVQRGPQRLLFAPRRRGGAGPAAPARPAAPRGSARRQWPRAGGRRGPAGRPPGWRAGAAHVLAPGRGRGPLTALRRRAAVLPARAGPAAHSLTRRPSAPPSGRPPAGRSAPAGPCAHPGRPSAAAAAESAGAGAGSHGDCHSNAVQTEEGPRESDDEPRGTHCTRPHRASGMLRASRR